MPVVRLKTSTIMTQESDNIAFH